MYTSFEVSNFRCFQCVKIGPLARVNLIAGKNNVGKTALLEALWLHSAPDVPNLGLRIGRFRGMSPAIQQESFRDLFYRFDNSSPIELSARGNWGTGSRNLRMSMRERQPTTLPLDESIDDANQAGGGGSTVSRWESTNEVELSYTNEFGETYTTLADVVQEQVSPGIVRGTLHMTQEHVIGRPDSVFLPARHRTTSQEDAERFGRMEIENRESELVEILRHVEPRLKRLTTISEHGTSMLYADIGAVRLIPVSLMGDGMGRLLSLALGFVTARDGIVLYDEIENGLHHSIMTRVWKSLAHFAQAFNVQIFAATHSHECVRSAHQAFQEERRYDFRLHRLDRVRDQVRVVTYDEEMLSTALASGLEVR